MADSVTKRIADADVNTREFYFYPDRLQDILALSPARRRELAVITRRAKELCGDDEQTQDIIYDNMPRWEAEPKLIARNFTWLGIAITSIQKMREIASYVLTELEQCEAEANRTATEELGQ